MDLPTLEAIFASMEQGVVFIDNQDRIAYCNPSAARIRNIQPDQILGQSILECHPSASHSKVLQTSEDLKSAKTKGHHRMNLQLAKGRFYDNIYDVSVHQDDESAFVRITDTGVGISHQSLQGVGISHQSLQEVFTRHFQEKAKPLGNVKGLGIGLSLVQEIIRLHKGEIHLESELGRGSTFTVRLPRQSPG